MRAGERAIATLPDILPTQAAAAVNDIMTSRYNHERREGRTHEDAKEAAVAAGEWWARGFVEGLFERCERIECQAEGESSRGDYRGRRPAVSAGRGGKAQVELQMQEAML